MFQSYPLTTPGMPAYMPVFQPAVMPMNYVMPQQNVQPNSDKSQRKGYSARPSIERRRAEKCLTALLTFSFLAYCAAKLLKEPKIRKRIADTCRKIYDVLKI